MRIQGFGMHRLAADRIERYSKNTWLMDTLIHRIPKAQSNSINLACLHTVIASEIIVIPIIIIISSI